MVVIVGRFSPFFGAMCLCTTSEQAAIGGYARGE